MGTFTALLRGINVGGHGILPMTELVPLCSGLGLKSVRTYIQSGNVVFKSAKSESAVRANLEKALTAKMGKEIDVMVRTEKQMRAVLTANPFPDRDPAKVIVFFLNVPLPKDLLNGVIAPAGEQVQPGLREIFVYYPDGMGRSKLRLPLKAIPSTARNINTVAKLVAIMHDL